MIIHMTAAAAAAAAAASSKQGDSRSATALQNGCRRRFTTTHRIRTTIVVLVCVSFLWIEAWALSTSSSRSSWTTQRKRLGRSSFLNKQQQQLQSNDNHDKILSPTEIHTLARQTLRKQPGSVGYGKLWRHWSAITVSAIRHTLSRDMPYAVNTHEYEHLAFGLGVAADRGEMPSFAPPGARAGYALDFFCRVHLLADLFMVLLFPSNQDKNDNNGDSSLHVHLLGKSNDNNGQQHNVTSLAGGPGFDFVAAAMVSTFCAGGDPYTNLHVTVLDYEPGWHDLVHAMNTATRKVLQPLQDDKDNGISPLSYCTWGGHCDITKSLYDPCNAACLAQIPYTRLWTCQYCVAENANSLRSSKFVFFRELFEAALPDSVFVFTETTPRLWPDFYDLIQTEQQHHDSFTMRLTLPKMRGTQMVLRKIIKSTGLECRVDDDDDDALLRRRLQDFEQYSKHHERLLHAGWVRQSRKDRSSRSRNRNTHTERVSNVENGFRRTG